MIHDVRRCAPDAAWLTEGDLPTPTEVTVLDVRQALERDYPGGYGSCPSTLITALQYFADAPDEITVVRADLVDRDDLDVPVDRQPSFWWHTIPRALLREAATTLPEEGASRPGRAVTFERLYPLDDWVAMTILDTNAEGYIGLGITEEHDTIHVPARQLAEFLAATEQRAR